LASLNGKYWVSEFIYSVSCVSVLLLLVANAFRKEVFKASKKVQIGTSKTGTKIKCGILKASTA
jgi:hypothetical protein